MSEKPEKQGRLRPDESALDLYWELRENFAWSSDMRLALDELHAAISEQEADLTAEHQKRERAEELYRGLRTRLDGIMCARSSHSRVTPTHLLLEALDAFPPLPTEGQEPCE